MFAVGYLLTILISLAIFLCVRSSLSVKVFIVAMLFMVFSFLIIPKLDSKVDALQYFSSLDAIRTARINHGLTEAWRVINTNPTDTSNSINSVMSFSATPVMALVMLGMSYFPDIVILSVVCFIDYFFALKIIQLVVDKNKLSISYYCFGFIIFCCIFAYSIAVSGIRNNMVGTVFAYFALKYLENERVFFSWSTISLLLIIILLSLVHPYTLLLGLLLLLVIIFWRYKTILRIIDGLMLLQSFFQRAIIMLLIPLAGIPFFSSIILKSNQYLGKNATILISSTANLFRDIGRLLIFGLLLIITLWVKQQFIDRRYIEFIIIFFCFACGAFFDQLLFERCMLVSLPIILPLIIVLPAEFSSELRSNESISLKTVAIYIMMIILCLYAGFCLVDNLRAGTSYYELFTFVGKY